MWYFVYVTFAYECRLTKFVNFIEEHNSRSGYIWNSKNFVRYTLRIVTYNASIAENTPVHHFNRCNWLYFVECIALK